VTGENVLLVLLVLVPLGAAALSLLLNGRPRAQGVLATLATLATVAMSVAVLVEVDRHGPLRVATSIADAPVGLTLDLYADRFSALMLVVSTLMLTAVLLYSQGQAAAAERSTWYPSAYLVLVAGVTAAFLAADLFNLFVAVELLLVSSYVLITLEGNDAQIRSGTTYVVINVAESTLLLMAVALVFAATGTLSFFELPSRLAALPDGIRTGLNLLVLTAFGLKAAVFPLFSWLPDSYPAAPGPVTAVFAGLLTKIGVYALIRTETLLFPAGQRTLLLWVAGFTMIVGVLGAIAQSDMKRILSFHIVSQIGYMVMGLALGGAAALAATVFFVVHQIPVKTSLFLVEGLVEAETGTSRLDRVGGFARRSGPLALMFLLAAMSLAGIPPLSGFVGKVGLVRAGFDREQWWITTVALAGSLLTLVSMLKIWSGVFWGSVEPEPRRPGVLRHHPGMSSATAAVVAVGLAIAVFAGPLYRYVERAAVELDAPATVASGDARPDGEAGGR
jgi:multicomponent Na+:H+ antiporter subunit D